MKGALKLIENSSSKGFHELAIIIRISQSIIKSLDYDHVLQVISNGMSELLDIESAAIYILENEQQLRLGATTPPLNPNMPESLRMAQLSDHPHICLALSQLKPIVIEDTQNASLSPSEKVVVDLRNLRTLLFLPFVQEGKALGTLILGTCNRIRTFTSHELELGQTVANQLATAIQNARLHRNLNDYKNNLEQLVKVRTHELESAFEELKSINEELESKNALVMQQKEELEATLHNLSTMEVKLFESEKMASLGILTAGVAHEINNPLNYIMGSYQGLELYLNQSAPEHYEKVSVLLNSMKVGIDRASSIVRSLNQFSRDSKNYSEDCELHTILNNCLLMLQYQYKDRIGITKKWANRNIIVKGNAGKLHQAFTNILVNAIQAIDNEGEIEINTELNHQVVTIAISDSGCGIPKENLPRITEPFFTTKAPQKGTGLGLSITYNIISDHNGKLEFESGKGIGTKVVITLPVSHSE